MPRPHLYLLLALLAAFGISHFSDRIDPYYLDVIIGIGINIILAVSLNLVNGHTGQFSLGHAGFMSVGAYTAAAVTLNLGPRLLGEDGGTELQQGLLFLGALTAGGLGAALGGLILGTVETFVAGSEWSTYKDAIAFAILIIILLFRPAGLLGKFTVEKV